MSGSPECIVLGCEESQAWDGLCVGHLEDDVDPDPEREPVRLGDLLPDVVDRLAEITAGERVHTRHTTETPDESERS